MAGTATIPYPDVFTTDRKQFGRWREMEGTLLSFIDYAAEHGPDLISGRPGWRWILLPWNADQQRYDDTRGSSGFDGCVPALTAWLESAGALTPVPPAEAAALLADSELFGAVGYDGQPLEEQFRRIDPARTLTIYPALATVEDRAGVDPWLPYAEGAA